MDVEEGEAAMSGGKSGDSDDRTQKLNRVSALLYDAYRRGIWVGPELLPLDLSESDAYRVQQDLICLKTLHSAERAAGYKISLTSQETQEMAGAAGPAYGILTDRNIKHSPAALNLSELNDALVEAEVVFTVARPLWGRPTNAEIVESTKLSVAIEVPNSRCAHWFPISNLSGFIGDCAASGAVVIGDEFAVPDSKSIEDLVMIMRCNGKVVAEGTGRQVLGSPLNAVRWLVSKLETVGRGLNPGDVVSSGTFITPIAARAGSFTAEISNLGQACVVFAS